MDLRACPPELTAALTSLRLLGSVQLAFTGTPCPGKWPHLAALGSRLQKMDLKISCPAPTDADAERQNELVLGLHSLAQLPQLELTLRTDVDQPCDAAHLHGLGSLTALGALCISQDTSEYQASMPAVVWDSRWRHLTRLQLEDVDQSGVDDAASPHSYRSPAWVASHLGCLRRLVMNSCDALAGIFPAALCGLTQLTYLVRLVGRGVLHACRGS